MNKNANSVRHLQNAAIAVLTVSAVFLLVQTPLVGDLAGKTPYELAQDWLAGDTSAETSVATDLTELALPVRVAFTNEYARYGLSAITTLDADFELAGAFFSEALDSAGVYEACSGEKLLAALHASSIYLDLETPTPLNVLSKILGVADAPESSLMHVTRLLLCPAESGTTLYLQDTDQGFFFSKTSVSSTALREALAALDGNGTDFAFSLSGDFANLSPYTLIFSDPPQRYALSASNALTDQAAFLRLADRRMADRLERLVLFSGDGDFRRLVEAVQRKGVHVTVVSSTGMIADELRREADSFVEVASIQQQIRRIPDAPASRELSIAS